MLDAIEEISDKIVSGNDLKQQALPAIPRKVLKYTLTDGIHLLHAIETAEMRDVNLF